MKTRNLHRPDHVVHILRDDEPERLDLVDARIGRIEGTSDTVESHLALDRLCKSLAQLFDVDGH